MKRRISLWSLIASTAGFLSALPIHAATITWDAGLNTGEWNTIDTSSGTTSNWSSQGVPGATDEARFDDASLLNPVRDIDLQTSQSVSGMSFDSAGAGYTLDTATSRHSLTLNSGAITVTDGDHTIESNLTLGSAGVWSVGTGDSLTIGGGLSGAFDVTKTKLAPRLRAIPIKPVRLQSLFCNAIPSQFGSILIGLMPLGDPDGRR